MSLATKAELCEVGTLENLLYEPGAVWEDDFRPTAHVASTVVPVVFSETIGFGKTMNADLPITADYIGDVWLVFELPPLPTGVCWTMSVGYALIESVQLLAGNIIMQSSNGLAMEIEEYLTTPTEHRQGVNEMVGRYDSPAFLANNAGAAKKIKVKLPFHFCKGSLRRSLPIFLLDRQRMSIRVKLAKFASVVLHESINPPEEIPLVDVSLLVEHHFVTDFMKASVRSQPYVRFVDQVQSHVYQRIPANSSTARVELDVMNSVKQLVWVVRESASEENNDWFNFSARDAYMDGMELMVAASLVFNGAERVPTLDESYFRLQTTERHRTVCGDRNIYVISFADRPEDPTNTGSVNLDKIENAFLHLTLRKGNPACSVYVFATSINIFHIENGVGRFRFLS
jgi:hypothetical protein